MSSSVRGQRDGAGTENPHVGEGLGRPAGSGASVREVCVLGLTRAAPFWRPGDRLEWSGRVYRVSATQGTLTPVASEPASYLYLQAPEVAERTLA